MALQLPLLSLSSRRVADKAADAMAEAKGGGERACSDRRGLDGIGGGSGKSGGRGPVGRNGPVIIQAPSCASQSSLVNKSTSPQGDTHGHGGRQY
jgi:hypothetical protein